MINRRSFLGSVIGLCAGYDFFAKTISEPIQVIPDLKIVEKYQLLFKDLESGYTVRAPGIKDIDSVLEHWKIIAHGLDITKKMTLNHCILVDKNSSVLRVTQFDCPVHVLPGDKFYATMYLDAAGSKTNDLEKAIIMWQEHEWFLGRDPGRLFEKLD